MYVKRRTVPERFPPNYSGNLSFQEEHGKNKESSDTDPCEVIKHEHLHRNYKVRKNIRRKCDDNDRHSLFENASNDDFLLLALLVFLYVGCDHSKENLILMSIIAYLLFGAKG